MSARIKGFFVAVIIACTLMFCSEVAADNPGKETRVWIMWAAFTGLGAGAILAGPGVPKGGE